MWLLGAGRGSDLDLTLAYDHLAYAEYKLGNLKKAVQYTRDLLQNGEDIAGGHSSVWDNVGS